jgi:hypothetical protein
MSERDMEIIPTAVLRVISLGDSEVTAPSRVRPDFKMIVSAVAFLAVPARSKATKANANTFIKDICMMPVTVRGAIYEVKLLRC